MVGNGISEPSDCMNPHLMEGQLADSEPSDGGVGPSRCFWKCKELSNKYRQETTISGSTNKWRHYIYIYIYIIYYIYRCDINATERHVMTEIGSRKNSSIHLFNFVPHGSKKLLHPTCRENFGFERITPSQ